jgi:hypothetical protein
MVCPIGAIFPGHDLPKEHEVFVTINADLAALWPEAVFHRPLPEAAKWRDIVEKRDYLDREPFTE